MPVSSQKTVLNHVNLYFFQMNAQNEYGEIF